MNLNKKPTRWTTTTIILTVILMILLFLFFAPAQLGGKTIYLIVQGNSMEPVFHPGDLVLLRKTTTYQINDIAAYQNTAMGGNVIHRIIDIEPDRYILQGDHNVWVDAYQPKATEMIGKYWFHLPGLGKSLEKPAPMLLYGTVFSAIGGFIVKKWLRKKENPNPTSTVNKPHSIKSGWMHNGMFGFAAVALAALAVLIISMTLPVEKKVGDSVLEQAGIFSYSAKDSSGLYETGTIQTGDPIFVSAACTVELLHQFTLAGEPLSQVHGTHQLEAVLIDDKSGWNRQLSLQPPLPFTGNSVISTAQLNICDIQKIIASVEEITGFHLSSYTLEITSSVAAHVVVDGQSLDELFENSFNFTITPAYFYLPGGEKKWDALQLNQRIVIPNEKRIENILLLPGGFATVSVRNLRIISAVLCALSLLAFGWVGFILSRRAQQSKVDSAGLKYQQLMIDVYEQNPARVSPVIDVASIDDLAKLAQHRNCMILHTQHEYAHYYFVKENDTSYRYVIYERKRAQKRTKKSPRFNLQINMKRVKTWLLRGLAAILAIGIVTSMGKAFAAGVNIPPIHMSDHSQAVTANDLKPDICDSLNLATIISGSGTITGTSGNDLILGSDESDEIDGGGGDDCILAGDGDDVINGNDGTDICAGGTGSNTYTLCETEVTNP